MAKHFDQKERDAIRERLCTLGEEEFAKRGLRAARVEDICLQVGISKGSFYNFFDAKEHLFIAVMERRERIYRQSTLELIRGHDGDAHKLIDLIFDHILEAVNTDPFITVMTQPGELEHLARKVGPEEMAKHQSGDMAFFRLLNDELKIAGHCDNAKPDDLGEMATLLFCTTMQRSLLPPDSFNAALEQVRDLFHLKLIGTLPNLGDKTSD